MKDKLSRLLIVFPLLLVSNSAFCDDRYLTIEAEVPPQQKTSLYYLVITLFVISVIACTLLTGAFLVLLILLWGQFKSIKYYWFLSQLTVSVFFLSSLNLVINVPATLFSLLTPDFVTSDIYIILSYTADYMHYSILISNLVIAIQRFSVFLFRNYSSTLFDSHFVYIWLVIVWLAPGAIIFFMAYNNCRYVFLKAKKDNFVLKCETAGSVVDLPQPEWIRFMELALQFGIPVLIFCMYVAVVFKICSMKKSALNKQETRVLVQAIIIFLLFQASSTVFLFCQTLSFNAATAFIIKKSINTLEIFAGAATPCFSFFASEKIRKMLSSKVPAISSQGSTNSAARKPTLVEVEN
ncbi:Protein CBG09424 [Caenorhabditis briggsae]|uniref:Protein CBG09424 n=1 Tax=Caenorhabditis briggsae TaxID=6238 RepID=A8X950_CAEBR|nr:Protein CBG09424 [Caenorhabditis briggsae]CAP29162.2 Protein CBG09424 [Caenorhabditis briggsae]